MRLVKGSSRHRLLTVDLTIGVKFDVHYDSLEKLKNFQITELPSHPLLYAKYSKEKFQWFQSIFERWTVLGYSYIPRSNSLNQAFPDLQTLKIEPMLQQSWISN